MRNCKTAAILFAILAVSACSGDKARIKGSIADAPEKQLTVQQLDVNKYTVLDTIKTGKDGAFSYDVTVKKGEPEFIYLFYGDTRVAGLLLEKGETAKVTADTLGNYSVTGSEGSEQLQEVDKAYADFIGQLLANINDNAALSKIYVNHYRQCVKYVMEHPYSLTTIPVLYERLSDISPVFNQNTDALFFKQAADSLKTVYPDSRYVKALEKEAQRRLNVLQIQSQIDNVQAQSFPELNLPDITGQKKALSSVDAKVILIHYWDASDAAQKMMNIEQLLPVYKDYHDKGFEIYAVCLDPDKAEWGSVVASQKLPWVNVNDGLGNASSSILAYNVSELPSSFLIVNGELSSTPIKGVEGLRRELDKWLRQ